MGRNRILIKEMIPSRGMILLAALSLSLTACSPGEEPPTATSVQTVSYEAPSGSHSSGDLDTPTMCGMVTNAEHIALLRVTADSQGHTECELEPFPLSSSYYETTVEVVDTLFGDPEQEFVLTTLHKWSHRGLESGDLVIAALRTTDNRVFGLSTVGVKPGPTGQQAATSATDLPSDLNVFRSRAADVKRDFSTQCADYVDYKMSDAEFATTTEEPKPVCSDDPFMEIDNPD